MRLPWDFSFEDLPRAGSFGYSFCIVQRPAMIVKLNAR